MHKEDFIVCLDECSSWLCPFACCSARCTADSTADTMPTATTSTIRLVLVRVHQQRVLTHTILWQAFGNRPRQRSPYIHTYTQTFIHIHTNTHRHTHTHTYNTRYAWHRLLVGPTHRLVLPLEGVSQHHLKLPCSSARRTGSSSSLASICEEGEEQVKHSSADVT